MTRFVWTIELRNAIALRCPKGAPRAHIGPREDGNGYIASILEPGLPSAGPFKERYQAALWAAEYVKRHLFPDAVIESPPRYVCANSEATKRRRDRAKEAA